jgi:O-succinylbenzoate synthase
MAKHGFETAIWHLLSLEQQKPLFQLLGGTNTIIQSGVSVGIEKSIGDLLQVIEGFLKEKYKRIKIKIKPGWDVKPVNAIRETFGDIPIMVDANSAYTLDDIHILKQLDDFNLMMIEQPLHYEDLTDHAQLQRQISTPICLDESISNLAMAKAAIKLKSCQIINIKPARVGGLTNAIKIHDFCKNNGIPVWCGGLLEMGIGRAFNIALSTLSNFTYPGDVSSSKKYFHQDIVSPEILFKHGKLAVPKEPGLGFTPDERMIKKFTENSITITP